MAEEGTERRLAAIMSADVAGYSRLMGKDETGTLSALKALRKDVFAPQVIAHKGRVVKLMGDGALVEFPSIVNAVDCAIAVQRALAERASGEQIKLRIGINLGDIIIEGNDIFGDGVNVAARVQELAAPGGIALSATAHEHAFAKVDVGFADGGEHELKNIAKPVRIYHWYAEADRQAGVADTESSLALPDKPSIAVLPFVNMSGDPEQEYFSDGITEDIITELSRYRELFVIARNSSFSYKGLSPKVQDVGRELGVGYVVEGSVRKAGNRIRVTAQLIEARTGTHIWAERFDRDLEDIFAVQDEVTQAIVAVLPVRLDGAALERAKRKPVESLTAYEHFLRARWRWTQDSADIAHAIEGIEMAIKLDPGFARAYAWLAIVYADSVFALSESLDEPAEKARFFAEKAVAADDQDAYVHASAAIAYSTCGDFDQAKRHADRAIALNPNEYMAIYARGMELSYGGDPEAGLAWYQKASRLDPQAPDFFLEAFVECHYMRRAYQDAVNFFNQWQNPPFYMYSVLAACHAQLGNMAEAAAAVETYMTERPSIHDRKLRTAAHLRMCKRQEDREHWLEGYRKAGFDV